MVVAVTAILIGLALPSLGRARERGRALASAANLRGIGAVMEFYVTDSGEYYPVGEVGRPYPVTISGEGLWYSAGDHFEFGHRWPVLVRHIAPWPEFWQTWLSPGRRRDQGAGSDIAFSYRYSHAFLARPELWRSSAKPDERLLTGVRAGDVQFPSSKVSFWDGDLSYVVARRELLLGMFANPTPMLFADGHAREEHPGDAAKPIPNVMNPDASESVLPLHNTPSGVHGRDY